MAFPENLRRIRLSKFFSQAELARRSGVHTVTIARLEAGATAPSTRTVRALAEALGVAPGELATPEEVAEADRRQRARAARPNVSELSEGPPAPSACESARREDRRHRSRQA
jgi:transcriptional regulator with XRE-family HTH domain